MTFRRSLAILLALGLSAVPVALSQEAPPPPHRPGPPPERAAAQDALARQIVEHLRRERPARFEELMNLRRTDPKTFAEEMRELAKEWQQRHRRERPPTPREELRARELSWRYHDSQDENERDKLRTEIAEAVDEAFEARVRAMEQRLQNMERELDTFRKRLGQLKENREAIREARVADLLRPPRLDGGGEDW